MRRFTQHHVDELVTVLGTADQPFEVAITLMDGLPAKYTSVDGSIFFNYEAKTRKFQDDMLQDLVRELREDFKVINERWPETKLYHIALHQYNGDLIMYSKQSC